MRLFLKIILICIYIAVTKDTVAAPISGIHISQVSSYVLAINQLACSFTRYDGTVNLTGTAVGNWRMAPAWPACAGFRKFSGGEIHALRARGASARV